MKAIVIIASLVALRAHAAPSAKDPADTEGERRDGCPAGIRRGYPGTEPARLGPPPEIDSVLAPTSFSFAFRGAYFMSHRDANADDTADATLPRARILTSLMHVHFALPFRWHVGSHTLLLHYTLGGTWAGARRWQEDQPRTPTQWLQSNTVAATGLRFNWMESIDHDNGVAIAGLRNAAGIQAYVGMPTRVDGDSYQSLASHTPFDDHLFRPNWPWGLSAEYRIEMVGCYAPFAHFRADVRREDTVLPHEQLVIPFTAAVGLNVSDNTVLTLQYGLIHYTDPGTYNVNAYHRLRFAIDRYFCETWRLGANIDVFSGSYEGMFLGLTFTDELGGDRFQ